MSRVLVALSLTRSFNVWVRYVAILTILGYRIVPYFSACSYQGMKRIQTPFANSKDSLFQTFKKYL